MSNKYVPLHEKLKYLRLINSKTQDEVARDLFITRACVSNYENGLREPDLKMLKRMAEYFKVEESYLLSNAKMTAALSEADKEEYVKLKGRVRSLNENINTSKMPLSSKIALHSFYEYLQYCDRCNKNRKIKKEQDYEQE